MDPGGPTARNLPATPNRQNSDTTRIDFYGNNGELKKGDTTGFTPGGPNLDATKAHMVIEHNNTQLNANVTGVDENFVTTDLQATNQFKVNNAGSKNLKK